MPVQDKHHPRPWWPGDKSWGAARGLSDEFDLVEGGLYYMRVYHPASYRTLQGRSTLRLQLLIRGNGSEWTPPRKPRIYDKESPCEPAEAAEQVPSAAYRLAPSLAALVPAD